jgi:membrane-associated HD superfamily phosphohydrolase
MASTTTMRYAAPARARVNRTRALGVVGAVLAAAAVWTIAAPLLGVHLLIRFGSGAPQSIGLDYVIGATVVTSLLGWAALALLERRTQRARQVWTALAVAVVLVSLTLPLIAGTTVATRVALALMHVAVAAVLIPTLRGGSASK